MKTKIKLTLCLTLFLSLSTWAQAPQKMSYQAILRNASGEILSNQKVGVRVSLLQGTETGAIVYQEAHNTTTNASGLVSLDVGAGSVLNGSFATINWVSGTFYLKTETDPAGGTNYSIVGSKQLMSVPYAFYAEKSGSGSAGGSSTFTESTFNSVPFMYTNANIKATSINGRNLLDAKTWNTNFTQMPNAALNINSPIGTLAADGSGFQAFVWNEGLAENATGNLYLNKFGGNTGIGYSGSAPRAQATLTVKRGFDSPWGTAAFEGTEHVSHFNYDKEEHTYIRGGKNTSNVYINDNPTGNVIIANGGGKVGIGTNNPTHKLSVNGTIRAKEIRVNTDWADFVFEKEYKLRPLAEVEKYILEHKHLPEIPSAKEIEGTEGGLNVGEMSKLFMQKIEELTLYMIEAQKQIDTLKKENELLKKEISK